MPRPYSQEKKIETLTKLAQNNGNVMLTSVQTGVSERTIQRWQQRRLLEASLPSQQDAPPPPKENSPSPPPPNNQEDEELTFDYEFNANQFILLRKKLMQHVLKLTASITDDDEYIHSKAVAISRLLDRIMKLDTELKEIYPQERITRFEYVMGNRVFDNPIWEYSAAEMDDPMFYRLLDEDGNYLPKEEQEYWGDW